MNATLVYVPCGGLLGVGCDLDGQLHGLHEGVARSLVDRLHRLDVNTRDHQVVLSENELVTHLVLLIKAKHRGTDDLGRVLKGKE